MLTISYGELSLHIGTCWLLNHLPVLSSVLPGSSHCSCGFQEMKS